MYSTDTWNDLLETGWKVTEIRRLSFSMYTPYAVEAKNAFYFSRCVVYGF